MGFALLGIVAAGAAAVLVGALQAARRANAKGEAPTTVEIVLAARDLDPKSTPILRAEHVTTKRVPPREAPKDCIPGEAQVVGKILAKPMTKGEVFDKRCLLTSGSIEEVVPHIPEDHVLTAINPALEDRVGGLVFPGAMVDVMASLREPDTNEVVHGCLLERIHVWGVGTRTPFTPTTDEERQKGRNSTRGHNGGNTGPITLLVTREQAHLLLMARYVNGTLTVVLRNPGETATGAKSVERVREALLRLWHKQQEPEPPEPEPPSDPPPDDEPKDEAVPGEEVVGKVETTRDTEGVVVAVTLLTSRGTKYLVDLENGKGRELGATCGGAKVVVTGAVEKRKRPKPVWPVEVIRGQQKEMKEFEVAAAGEEHDLVLKVFQYRAWEAGDGEGLTGRTGPGRAEPNDNQRPGQPRASGHGGQPGTHHQGAN